MSVYRIEDREVINATIFRLPVIPRYYFVDANKQEFDEFMIDM